MNVQTDDGVVHSLLEHLQHHEWVSATTCGRHARLRPYDNQAANVRRTADPVSCLLCLGEVRL